MSITASLPSPTTSLPYPRKRKRVEDHYKRKDTDDEVFASQIHEETRKSRRGQQPTRKLLGSYSYQNSSFTLTTRVAKDTEERKHENTQDLNYTKEAQKRVEIMPKKGYTSCCSVGDAYRAAFKPTDIIVYDIAWRYTIGYHDRKVLCGLLGPLP